MKMRLQLLTRFAMVWAFGLIVLVIGFNACGAPETLDVTLEDKVANASAVPSKDNYDTWKGDWHNRWIVALKDDARFTYSREAIKNTAVLALLDFKGIKEGSEAFFAAQPLLQSALSVDFVDLNGIQTLAEIPIGKIHGFGAVTFHKGSQTWQNLREAIHLPIQTPEALERDFVFSAWDALRKIPQAAWVEPDIDSKVFDYTPPGELSGSGEVPKAFARFHGDLALQLAAENNLTTKRNPVVAVIDTGVDYKHPKLESQMFTNPYEIEDGIDNDGNGYIDDVHGIDASFEADEVDPSPQPTPGAADLGGPGVACPQPGETNVPKTGNGSCGHGTHVAGIIAAKSDNTTDGPLGICQACRIYSFRSAKVLQDSTGAFVRADSGISDLAQLRAMSYTLKFTPNGSNVPYINIINMSIGKYFRSRSIGFLVRSLQRANVLVVAAAGNENTETPSYPGAFASVLSVCATSVNSGDMDDGFKARGNYAKTEFSNFGEWVDICAPGQAIRSTYPGSEIQRVESGTSQATPIVAGAAGFLLSIFDNLTPYGARELLLEYADANSLYSDKLNQETMEGHVANANFFYLGTGELDLKNTILGQLGTGSPSPIANNPELIGQNIREGCVISSVAGTGKIPLWHFFMSMPFLLLQCYFVLRFFRASQRRAPMR